MKRGEIWVRSRFGRDRHFIVVGAEAVTARNVEVLMVPISDVLSPDILAPQVSDSSGSRLGVALIEGIGGVHKSALTKKAGELSPECVEIVDMNLRAALAL